MSSDHFNFIDSILIVTPASGSINEEILNDLNIPEGKSIAELLNDKEIQIKTNQETNNEKV